MAGFFRIDYQGASGIGAGAMALANGKVVGMDVGGGIYKGAYSDDGTTTEGTVVLQFEAGGRLVTGTDVPPGFEINIPFRFPSASEKPTITVNVAGQTVTVLLARVGDL